MQPAEVITGLQAYSAGQELLVVYSERLASSFLHMLLSEMQLLDDGTAVRRTASSDWEEIASTLPGAEGERMLDMSISAIDGLRALVEYVHQIGVRTDSDELARFVGSIGLEDLRHVPATVAPSVWQDWVGCLEKVAADPDGIHLSFTAK